MTTFHVSDEDETGEDAFIAIIDAESYEAAAAWLIKHTQVMEDDLINGRVKINEVLYHYKVRDVDLMMCGTE